VEILRRYLTNPYYNGKDGEALLVEDPVEHRGVRIRREDEEFIIQYLPALKLARGLPSYRSLTCFEVARVKAKSLEEALEFLFIKL